VIYVDRFGNLITNIDRACVERLTSRFRGQRLSVRIGREPAIEIRNSYGEAESGGCLATFGSFEMLEIAVRDGSAAERYAARCGMKVTIGAVQRSIDG
jgi:S-adenosylmethionine hydrolase